jgi:hypothetical protein|mmetsp:Transcript_13298/g.2093  ORF Transcript_13298/g.2093 Transcript_13298/m.2093 type:complete len:87 (+) Transcript_13298:2773-3033(+)
MMPIQSGSYLGAITFHDPDGHFVWFTVEVNTEEPEPEEEKTLMCQCRKAVELKITVYNPSEEDTTFEVAVEGEGLLGDHTFFVASQ